MKILAYVRNFTKTIMGRERLFPSQRRNVSPIGYVLLSSIPKEMPFKKSVSHIIVINISAESDYYMAATQPYCKT